MTPSSIDWHFVIAMSCLFTAMVLGLSVAWRNLNDEEGRERRIEARRAFKKEKNERLRRFYGLPPKE